MKKVKKVIKKKTANKPIKSKVNKKEPKKSAKPEKGGKGNKQKEFADPFFFNRSRKKRISSSNHF